MRNEIIPYNRKLRDRARKLRNNSTLTEVVFWNKIKNKRLGVEFHRQVPINNFIVDFYCHELKLAIEIDGESHKNKVEYERERQRIIESYGVKFVRFGNDEVKRNMTAVLDSLISKVSEVK